MEERFKIGKFIFLVIEQDTDEYAILVKHPKMESFWLQYPESRFETLGGAYGAILDYLNNVDSSLIAA